MSAVSIPVPARPPDPYHVYVTPADPDDPALDGTFTDSVIDARSDVIVLVCGLEYLEVHVASVRSRDRVARALAVTAGLLATHGQLFMPGLEIRNGVSDLGLGRIGSVPLTVRKGPPESVVHACWDDKPDMAEPSELGALRRNGRPSA